MVRSIHSCTKNVIVSLQSDTKTFNLKLGGLFFGFLESATTVKIYYVSCSMCHTQIKGISILISILIITANKCFDIILYYSLFFTAKVMACIDVVKLYLN